MSEAVGTRMLGDNAGGSVEKIKSLQERDYDAVMIDGLADKNLVDGDGWKGVVYAIGRYQYTTVMGAKRTVPRFTVSRATAREYVAKQQ